MPKKKRAAASVEALTQEIERLKTDATYFEQQYRLLAAFMNSAPFAVYIKNGKREYCFFNAVRQGQFDLKPDDILWHTDLDLVGNLWGILAHEQDAKVLAEGQSAETLESAPHDAQEQRNWLIVRFPFAGPKGEAYIGAVGIDTSKIPSINTP